MSRLTTSDIHTIETQLREYETVFIRQTGHTLADIAKLAVGLQGNDIKRKTAVVPITSGLGIIGGFSEAVAAILRHAGTETLVTTKTDVAGLQEAYLSGYELAFMADDDVCAAFGIGSAVQSDNGRATGRSFAAALTAAIKNRGISPDGARVLVVGAGPVGQSAAEYLAEQRAVPVLCDLDKRKAAEAATRIHNAAIISAPPLLKSFPYIIEASTAADFISAEDVTAETIIAAPGMPCGVTDEARDKATVIHNPLELGIMTMYFDCLKKLEE